MSDHHHDGHASGGRGHWVQERAAALAMLPLSLWASFFMLRAVGRPQRELASIIGQWRRATPMALLACLAARHTQLGLEVIIGDYLRGQSRQIAKAVTRLLCGAFALSVMLSLFKLMCQRHEGQRK